MKEELGILHIEEDCGFMPALINPLILTLNQWKLFINAFIRVNKHRI